jgi:pyruvate dehydrogenase E1 component alpha subunit
MMAEIYGKRTGICHGKGGSMHIADLDKGMMGANGIVGGGPPLVCGAALAAKVRGTDNVAVAFVGDGGSNQGTTLESLNLAQVWKLPAIFVAENNGYAEATSRDYAVGTDSIAGRAAAFGMPALTVDGHDFFAVYEAVGEAVARARRGEGPAFIECEVNRYFGHFEGDAQTYRGPDEAQKIRESRDCITGFVGTVVDGGQVDASELAAIDGEVADLIDGAVRTAKSDPKPTAEDLLTDVYVSY